MGCMAALEAETFPGGAGGAGGQGRGIAPPKDSRLTPDNRPDTMMDWDKLRVFHAVAEAGSFTRAGEALNLSQSAVSRQISALEESAATSRCSTAMPAA